MKSKSGSDYYYGWAGPGQPDIRDLCFSAPPEVVSALPAEVDQSVPALPAPFEPAWDQSRIGSCGPHTAVADIVFAALRQDGLASVRMPSRLFVYYCTRLLMGTLNQDSGVQNRAMLKALAQYGWCDEELWPYDIRRFREKPPTECFVQAATRKIAAYRTVPQTLDQMKACLAGGDPFIFGFSVYQSFEHPSVRQTGIVPMPGRNEQQVGGHDVLICAYSDRTGRFKFKNSYGSDWGQNGYGEIPYEYAANPRLAGDFWTVQHSALPKPSPVPEPLPPAPPAASTVLSLKGVQQIQIDGRTVWPALS